MVACAEEKRLSPAARTLRKRDTHRDALCPIQLLSQSDSDSHDCILRIWQRVLGASAAGRSHADRRRSRRCTECCSVPSAPRPSAARSCCDGSGKSWEPIPSLQLRVSAPRSQRRCLRSLATQRPRWLPVSLRAPPGSPLYPSLNVSAQVALPEWVRGRGLAMYVTVMFGALTIGSAIWGQLAVVAGLPAALLLVAAAGAVIGIPLTGRWKLQTGADVDFSPSMQWPDPVTTHAIEAGPRTGSGNGGIPY